MIRATHLFQVLVLTLALTLSGCTGDTGDDSSELTTSTDNAKGSAPNSGSAGTTNVTPTEQSFEWEGTLSNLAAACVVITCVAQGSGNWDGATKLTDLTAAKFTLSWDDTTAPELGFGLASACDGSCEFVQYAQSSSPVTLDLGNLDPVMTYTLVAWHPYHCIPVVCLIGTQIGAQTDFQVAGTLMVV